MPLTPDLRRKVDQIRDYLYGGGYPDPMSNAEQLAFLFYFYLSEGLDRDNAARARIAKQEYANAFAGEWTLRNPLNAPAEGQKTIPADRLRWSVWAKALTGEGLVRFVRDEVFAFYAEVAERSAYNFMEGARLGIDDPTVLTQVVGLVDDLRLDQADADTKGDLFEHVLKQISQAGELGQFRTPRHVIRAMVRILDPQVGETVYDPAAGTAGFLVAAYDHMRLTNSSPGSIEQVEVDGKPIPRGPGDMLSAAKWEILARRTFYGNDVDPKMVRLATMNLSLRGLPQVAIRRRNVLTTTLDAQQKQELGLPPDGYAVVLANPPFSGRVDKDRIVDDVKVGATTATELLFLRYMIDSLRLPAPSGSGAGGEGGRCAVVVPEGVLFGSTGAHKELRRQLLENNTVEAVLSLPGGVFQPYSGVKTSVLVFRKGGTTERVLFLHADNDGYKLDAQHTAPIEQDDLPGLVTAYQKRAENWRTWHGRDEASPWENNWWFATADAIRANDFNLSASRYRPLSRTQVEHRSPLELLDELAAIEREILEEVESLRDALSGEAT